MNEPDTEDICTAGGLPLEPSSSYSQYSVLDNISHIDRQDSRAGCRLEDGFNIFLPKLTATTARSVSSTCAPEPTATKANITRNRATSVTETNTSLEVVDDDDEDEEDSTAPLPRQSAVASSQQNAGGLKRLRDDNSVDGDGYHTMSKTPPKRHRSSSGNSTDTLGTTNNTKTAVMDADSLYKLKNKENARKNRLKKKAYIATLEEGLSTMMNANRILQETIIRHVGPTAVPPEAIKMVATAADSVRDQYRGRTLLPASIPSIAASLFTSDSLSNISRVSSEFSWLHGTHNNAITGIPAAIPKVDMPILRYLQSCEKGFIAINPGLADEPVIFCDEGFERMSGYSKEDILGRNVRYVMQSSQGEVDEPTRVMEASIAASITQTLRSGGSGTWHVKCYSKDGSPFWSTLTLSCFVGPVGSPMLAVCSFFKVQ
jgi:hypothetical protein